MTHLAKNLHTLRKEFDYTQAEMPALIGVTRTTWSNWENNKSEPEVSKLIEIAQLFGVTLDTLLTVDVAENVHLIQKTGEKTSSKNVHLNVHPIVRGTKLSVVSEPDTSYETQKKEEVDLLILRQLNAMAKDLEIIKSKLP